MTSRKFHRGVLENLPRVHLDALRDLALVVHEPGVGDGVRHAVRERRIDNLTREGLVEVLPHVGALRVVDRFDHALLRHLRNLVGARRHQVVASAARLELRVHRLVRVERVNDDLDAECLLETYDKFRREVVGPGVDVKLAAILTAFGKLVAARLRGCERLRREVH